MKTNCPICGKHLPLFLKQGTNEKDKKYFPFCSQRCKLIDMGAWLDAEYRIPAQKEHEDTNNLSN
jgi:endogenous inhibitor of DNA gyrase (YacG/DUF329 family)